MFKRITNWSSDGDDENKNYDYDDGDDENARLKELAMDVVPQTLHYIVHNSM